MNKFHSSEKRKLVYIKTKTLWSGRADLVFCFLFEVVLIFSVSIQYSEYLKNCLSLSSVCPSVFQKADAVRTTTFTGCMGETFLDGKAIGLWNYRERQGDCKGCVVRWRKQDCSPAGQTATASYASYTLQKDTQLRDRSLCDVIRGIYRLVPTVPARFQKEDYFNLFQNM